MLRKFLAGKKIFGLRLVPESEYADSRDHFEQQTRLTERVASAEEKSRRLQAQIEALELENESLRARPAQIDPFMGDIEPKDAETRKLYVAQVAGFHKDVLDPKLRKMIASTHVMLEEASNDRDTDQAIKGTLYAFRELIRWGSLMVNEHVSNQTVEEPKT